MKNQHFNRILRVYSLAYIFTIFFSLSAYSQLNWVNVWENPTGVKGMTLDKQKNIYICGTLSPNYPFQGITVTTNGYQDGFLAKYDPNGVFQWVRTFGGKFDVLNPREPVLDSESSDQATSLFYDSTSNSVYVACAAKSGLNQALQVHSGSTLVASFDLPDRGRYYGGLLQFDTQGNFIWGTELKAIAKKMDKASNGDLYMMTEGGILRMILANHYFVWGAADFYQPNFYFYDMTIVHNKLIFVGRGSRIKDKDSIIFTPTTGNQSVIALDLNGKFVGKHIFISKATFDKIDSDKAGNLYVYGSLNDSMTMGNVLINPKNIPGNNCCDMYYAKIDSNFNFCWARQLYKTKGNFVGNTSSYFTDIKVVDNKVLLVGKFEGNVVFKGDTLRSNNGVNGASFLLVKSDTSGNQKDYTEYKTGGSQVICIEDSSSFLVSLWLGDSITVVGNTNFKRGVAIARIKDGALTGINVNKQATGLQIFPNPHSGQFKVIAPSSLDKSKEFTIQISTTEGKVLETAVYQFPTTEIEIDMQHCAIGIYLIKLQQGEKVFTEKVIKE